MCELSDCLQGFGVAEVSEAGDLTFRIVDLDGSDLYTKTFEKP